MRFVGGKSRISNWIRDQILLIKGSCDTYIEPFLGGGNVFPKVAPHFSHSYCGDAHLDLILMWRAVASGWVPPEEISKDLYEELRHAKPSALRGFAGYGASFSGKWFGGYVDTAWDTHHNRYTKPYPQAASRAVVKCAESLAKSQDVRHSHYSAWRPAAGDLVYCDPPYAGTLGYSANSDRFNSEDFWATAEMWAIGGATVVVSESTAPATWTVLAERERKAMLRVASRTPNLVRAERLYAWSGRVIVA